MSLTQILRKGQLEQLEAFFRSNIDCLTQADFSVSIGGARNPGELAFTIRLPLYARVLDAQYPIADATCALLNYGFSCIQYQQDFSQHKLVLRFATIKPRRKASR